MRNFSNHRIAINFFNFVGFSSECDGRWVIQTMHSNGIVLTIVFKCSILSDNRQMNCTFDSRSLHIVC